VPSAPRAHAHSLIRRNPRVVFRNLANDQGSVLLHLDTGAYHGVNSTGALVYELLERDQEFGDLLHEVRRRLATVPPTLDDEIGAFLEELAERDLVQLTGTRPQP